MKISVSLPQEDVAFVDEYAAKTEADSRSAVIHAAIELLREAGPRRSTPRPSRSGTRVSAALWDRTAGDGIVGA